MFVDNIRYMIVSSGNLHFIRSDLFNSFNNCDYHTAAFLKLQKSWEDFLIFMTNIAVCLSLLNLHVQYVKKEL